MIFDLKKQPISTKKNTIYIAYFNAIFHTLTNSSELKINVVMFDNNSCKSVMNITQKEQQNFEKI